MVGVNEIRAAEVLELSCSLLAMGRSLTMKEDPSRKLHLIPRTTYLLGTLL